MVALPAHGLENPRCVPPSLCLCARACKTLQRRSTHQRRRLPFLLSEEALVWIFLCWCRLWLCPQPISKRSATLPSCLHGRESSAHSSDGSSGMVVQVLGLNPERSRASCSGPRVYLGPREGTESPGFFQGWSQAKRTVRGDLVQLFERQLQRWWDQTLVGSGRWYNEGQRPRVAVWDVHTGR